MSMWFRPSRQVSAAMTLALALLHGCSPAPGGPPPLRVSVARPIVRSVIDWDDYVGRFVAIQDVTVTPRISGSITTILFRNGQDVTAGQCRRTSTSSRESPWATPTRLRR
ncbi:MAG: hypothetical protein WDM81_06060 [Rhizomicrobium sp.]